MDFVNMAQELDASRNWAKHAIGSTLMFILCLRQSNLHVSITVWREYQRRWRNHETPFN